MVTQSDNPERNAIMEESMEMAVIITVRSNKDGSVKETSEKHRCVREKRTVVMAFTSHIMEKNAIMETYLAVVILAKSKMVIFALV